jgi:hypothetical protein
VEKEAVIIMTFYSLLLSSLSLRYYLLPMKQFMEWFIPVFIHSLPILSYLERALFGLFW